MVISWWLSFSALLFQISTYALGNLAIVVGVHQLEGLLVLGLLSRELLPGQHAVAVLVVRREHLVHVLSSENKRQHKQLFSMRPISLIHILRHSNIQRFGINKPFLNQTQYINLHHTLIVNSLGDFNPSLGERSEPVLS